MNVIDAYLVERLGVWVGRGGESNYKFELSTSLGRGETTTKRRNELRLGDRDGKMREMGVAPAL